MSVHCGHFQLDRFTFPCTSNHFPHQTLKAKPNDIWIFTLARKENSRIKNCPEQRIKEARIGEEDWGGEKTCNEVWR